MPIEKLRQQEVTRDSVGCEGSPKAVSVPLQTVPEDQEGGDESPVDVSATQAKHEAAEIVARAHRQAESIVAEARTSQPAAAPSPLAALGDNAEEIIGQVRKLIKKQRELQDERQEMLTTIDTLKAERDELVQRLTDAVVRMEELSALAAQAQSAPEPQQQRPSPPPSPPPSPQPAAAAVGESSLADRIDHVDELEDTSLAARLGKVEREESSSLAARLKQAEREEREGGNSWANGNSEATDVETFTDDTGTPSVAVSDKRSFYDRHSAKLPRLEGDGGRSVLSAVTDMRPDLEQKGRKGRRRKK
jgi:hypothetical protein